MAKNLLGTSERISAMPGLRMQITQGLAAMMFQNETRQVLALSGIARTMKVI
jgi:hypothetical protein